MNKTKILYEIERSRNALSEAWQTAFDDNWADTTQQVLISQEHVEKLLKLLSEKGILRAIS